MELTRRDALTALAAAGVVAATGAATRSPETAPLAEHEVETLVAVAGTAYPSDVAGVASFVRRYSVARVDDDPDYRRGVRRAIDDLDVACRSWFDAAYADLDADARERALYEVGAVQGSPDPDGGRGERIRYYVLNELLYAFYTTPTGSGLAGLENPPGYPGGDTSYQRGPQ